MTSFHQAKETPRRVNSEPQKVGSRSKSRSHSKPSLCGVIFRKGNQQKQRTAESTVRKEKRAVVRGQGERETM